VLSLFSGQLSVSGLSSGGFAAVQFHVIYSSKLNGAGIVAGGPYWCAQGDLAVALTSCTTDPEFISVDELIDATSFAYDAESIDDPSNLKNQPVYLFSGTEDRTVYQGVMEKLQSYYANYVDATLIRTEFNISANHAMITDNYGNNCEWFGTPFINNCGYSAAGAIFETIYGSMKPPAKSVPHDNIKSVDQNQFIPDGYTGESAGLDSLAYIYYPTNYSCDSDCRIHIVFHGCNQSYQEIGTTYVEHAGYNYWAETNNIIVLYPQVKANLLNPRGCWDWWGYTTEEYATYNAPQMAAGMNMMQWVRENHSHNKTTVESTILV